MGWNVLKNRLVRSVLLSAVLMAPSQNSSAACASCWACVACVSVTVGVLKTQSAAAFQALHLSITTLGNAFSMQLGLTSKTFVLDGINLTQNIKAASDSITSEVKRGTTAEQQLWDAFNAQSEIRHQQRSMLDGKAQAEQTVSAETLPRNLMNAFANQTDKSISSYQEFLENHQELYIELLKSERAGILESSISPEQLFDHQKLLWGGEIATAEDAAALVLLTQQLLFQDDIDPFNDLLNLKARIGKEGISRDEAELSNSFVWASRIKPALDFFSFDHGLRTKPNQSDSSVLAWLQNSVDDSLYQPDGISEAYADASVRDLTGALAVETKKRLLVSYLKMSLGQLQEQMQASELAMQADISRQALRYQVSKDDFHLTSKTN